MLLSARAIGGGLGEGTTFAIAIAGVIDLGMAGVSFGVVSGNGQGGANALSPVIDPDLELKVEPDLGLGAMIDGRRQSVSSGEPAMMVASLDVDEDRDRDPERTVSIAAVCRSPTCCFDNDHAISADSGEPVI